MMKFDHQSQLLDRFPVEEENPLVSNKLRIRLKVNPETTGDECGRSDWICRVCNKGFRSSKALGGHTRVHMEQQRALSKGDKDDGPRTCSLCKKSFRSRKSLFGHMRCHPERHWRGMQPPAATATAKAAAATGLSDSTPPPRAVADADGSNSPVLLGWPTKARRGRLSTAGVAADDDEDFNGAVYGLMLLSTGKDCYKIQHVDVYDDYEIGNYINEKAAMISSGSYDMSSRLYQLEPVNETNSMEITDCGKKRKRETGAKSYSCIICNKSFQSPQALGGHTSSAHNKVLIRNSTLRQDGVLVDAYNNSIVFEEDCGVARAPALVLSASVGHICGICHKAFPSGQALGGHKRCHWPGPSSPGEAQAEPPLRLPCPNKRELPGFDLNQIPADLHLIDQEAGPHSAAHLTIM